jgi:predicted nuclease with TOPRIM domain
MAKTLWEKIEAKFAELTGQLKAQPGGAGDGGQQAILAQLRTELESGSEENATQATAITAKDGEIATLKAKVAELEGKITAKDGEITTLKAAAKTAGEQAADIVASTGVDPRELPAAKPGDGTQVAAKSLKQQYLDLQKQGKHQQAAQFYAEHSSKKEFWR